MKFFKFLDKLISEETTTADIAKVDSRIGNEKDVQKRKRHEIEGREDEVENDAEEDNKDHYEDLKINNQKSAEVKQQLKNVDRT